MEVTAEALAVDVVSRRRDVEGIGGGVEGGDLFGAQRAATHEVAGDVEGVALGRRHPAHARNPMRRVDPNDSRHGASSGAATNVSPEEPKHPPPTYQGRVHRYRLMGNGWMRGGL